MGAGVDVERGRSAGCLGWGWPHQSEGRRRSQPRWRPSGAHQPRRIRSPSIQPTPAPSISHPMCDNEVPLAGCDLTEIASQYESGACCRSDVDFGHGFGCFVPILMMLLFSVLSRNPPLSMGTAIWIGWCIKALPTHRHATYSTAAPHRRVAPLSNRRATRGLASVASSTRRSAPPSTDTPQSSSSSS